MDEQIYAFYPVFRAGSGLRDMGAGERDAATHEVELLLKEWSDRVAVRGVYSTVGFRPDGRPFLEWSDRWDLPQSETTAVSPGVKQAQPSPTGQPTL